MNEIDPVIAARALEETPTHVLIADLIERVRHSNAVEMHYDAFVALIVAVQTHA